MCLFFFNYTATTEIYTYQHTLSLHEALPICGSLTEMAAADRLQALREDTGCLVDLSFDTISGAGPNGAVVHYRAEEKTNRAIEMGTLYLVDSRSEEHTSELQSLMRISYAVFCLKKKKKINQRSTQPTTR